MGVQNKGGNITIIRFFRKEGRKNKIVKEGVSLEFAQAWCSHPKTQKAGVYFDGYTSVASRNTPIYKHYEFNNTDDLDTL